MSVRADVDRGLAIVAELEALVDELKKIDERLKQAALAGHQVELNDPDRGGKQFLATGSESVVPIILTDDKLMGEFPKDSDKHKKIVEAAQGRLTDFFKPVNKFENRFDSGKKFRKQAAEILGADAPAFITACIARDKDGVAKSDVKVCWKEAKNV